MSIVNKSWFRVFRILLLIMMMTSVVQQAKAMMPPAGMPIGTKATITYRDASDVLQKRESDVVLTMIAQVYQVKVIAIQNPAHAEQGENADIPFQVTNVGNGTDDVTLTVNKFTSDINDVTFFNADAGGVLQPGTGIDSSKSNPSAFTLKGVEATGDQRYFVLRMPLPKSARKDDKFKIDLDVMTKDGTSTSVTAHARVIDQRPFSVIPGRKVILNKDKKAWVSFSVRGGEETKKGYFQMWAVKSTDGAKSLKYEVEKHVTFDRKDLSNDEFDGNDNTLLKMVHEVSANETHIIKFLVKIDAAERGDEIVMFTKYGEANPSRVEPLFGDDSLEKSTGFVISFDHIAISPDLKVTGNSNPGSSSDYTEIKTAIAGGTVSYDLLLQNKSTFPDTFIIEEQTKGKGELIAKVIPMDIDGQQEIPMGVNGPETGVIAPDGQLRFKILIRLSDGRTSKKPQIVQFRIKPVQARNVDSVTQTLIIHEIIAGQSPIVEFSNTDDMSSLTHRLTIDNGENAKRFYLQIKNASNIDGEQHDYQMAFAKNGFHIKLYSEQSCGPVVTSTGSVGVEGKIFCVDADLTGISSLESEFVVSDPIRATEVKSSILIEKMPILAFANTSYDGNGSPDSVAALTIRVVNHGGDTSRTDYEIFHDKSDTKALTLEWPTVFSFEEKKWESFLSMPEMKSGNSKAVFVKITIPKDAAVNREWLLTLGLRKKGEEHSVATTVLTLSLDESGLVVVKEVAILKSPAPGNCGRSALPVNFSKTTDEEVKDGDCIWYRVSVTNLSTVAIAHDVTISDPIPKYSSYSEGARANFLDANPSMNAGKIVTEGIDLESDAALILTYPVTINFSK